MENQPQFDIDIDIDIVQLKYKSNTKILSVGIKYSVRDLLFDVICIDYIYIGA